MLARLIATAIHEVAREFQRLEAMSTTSETVSCVTADTERAGDEPQYALGFSLPPSPEARP